MTIAGLSIPSQWYDIATTTLNSLANNGIVDTSIDLNTYRSGGSGTGVFPVSMNVGLLLASLTPGAGTAIYAYALTGLDNDSPSTIYADEYDDKLIKNWTPTSSAGVKNLEYPWFPLNRVGRYFKLRIKNALGVSLASSGNILRVQFRFDEGV